MSLLYEVRYRLAWDGAFMADLLAVFLRVVYGWYGRQARKRDLQLRAVAR